MKTHVDKQVQSDSKSVAKVVSQKQSLKEPAFSFSDNRREAVLQKKWQDLADGSPRMKGNQAIQKMADGSVLQKQHFQAFARQNTAPNGPIVQRVFENDATGDYALNNNPEYASSLNAAGAGRKPLLTIGTMTPNVKLHVHLVPDMPPTKLSGWKLKNEITKARVAGVTDETRNIDQGEIALLNAHAPRWAQGGINGPYPGDLHWNNPTNAEQERNRAALRQTAENARVAALRSDYEKKLQAKKARELAKVTASRFVVEGKMSRSRKKKGETAIGYSVPVRKRILANLKINQNVAIKFDITEDSGAFSVTIPVDVLTPTEKNNLETLQVGPDLNVEGLHVKEITMKNDKETLVQQKEAVIDAYIKEVSEGTRDQEIKDWDNGGRRATSPNF